MKLSVIIVNYNVRHFLEQALHSVRHASEKVETEVYVVDNNSVDDSVAMVQEKFPEVKVMANRENVGFSKANNQAMAVAQGEYVLLLNPDTVVEEDTFEKCVAFMDAHPDAGGLGVKMIDGKGNFLPESKRGFPSPSVAFYKTFGLSKIFPKSRIFNRYHLGYLDKDETNPVDVLSGAFMLLRKTALDKIGFLDEAFFMYGEDIDLSYRILQAGYKNYYFAGTCIIHYKGESTKKGSLNYVRTFYQAMIIFANKHFSGRNAQLFVLMLRAAIWFRAGLTLAIHFFKKAWLPLADAAAIFGGLLFLKNTWGHLRFDNPDYFQPDILYFNFPLYIFLWLGSAYLSGGYDQRNNLRQFLRGLMVGTICIAAVYGFLDSSLRASRMLIVLGAAWALFATVGIRALMNLVFDGNLMPSQRRRQNLIIVGAEAEADRVLRLLQNAGVEMNFIGTVSPGDAAPDRKPQGCLGSLYQLQEIVDIFKVDEIVFCSLNLGAQEIIRKMTQLGPDIDYKIVPEGSLSIIGSNSKNTAGDLYTIEIRFNIAQPVQRRNKRVLDLLVSAAALLTLPILLFLQKKPLGLLANIFRVLWGRASWVGYQPSNGQLKNLPKLRPGILTPLNALRRKPQDEMTVQRLNFLYAKDYSTMRDVEIILKGVREMGMERRL